MRTLALAKCLSVLALLFFTPQGFAASPCVARWLSGYGAPGVGFASGGAASLRDSIELPNGDVIVAGSFNIVGATRARNIARLDRASGMWHPLGTGVNGIVNALALMPNGDLIAAGKFTEADGVPLQSIARWNGTTWSALPGGGISDGILAILALPDGGIIAGGKFEYAGNAAAQNIAQWNGSAWAPMGSGMRMDLSSNDAQVEALARLPAGDIVAGGHFEIAGGVSSNGIARWDGAAWKAFGSGLGTAGYPFVGALDVLPDGTLIAGGSFGSIDGVTAVNLAAFDGLAWHAIGSGVAGSIFAVRGFDHGEILAGGSFSFADKVLAASIARWDGVQWRQVGGGVGGDGGGTVYSITRLSDNSAVIGGQFSVAGGIPALNGAFLPDSEFSLLAPAGLNGTVQAIAQLPSGDFVLAGEFTQAGGVGSNRIVRWDGTAFHNIGAGMSAKVSALAVLPDGDLVAGGDFTYVSGRLAPRVARWNGAEWSPLGSGLSASVKSLLALPDGSLVVGGAFITAGGKSARGVARWNGSEWNSLGTGVSGGTASTPTVYALARTPQGDIIAAGEFGAAGDTAALNIARWDGTTWSALGQGVNASSGTHRALALRVLPGGDLVVGGSFARAGGIDAKNIARWNGQAWSPLGSGVANPVYALQNLADGSLLAGGTGVVRWTGAQWEAFSDGTDTRTIVQIPSGDIFIGGSIGLVGSPGSVYSQYFARMAASGAPILGTQPSDSAFDTSHVANLFAAVCVGLSDADVDSIQWLRNSVPVSNGPGGASPGGGTVVGATTLFPDGTMRLEIDDLQMGDAGMYEVVLTNSCGDRVSRSAILTVRANVADLNADGVVNDVDFQLFAAQYDVVLCNVPEMPGACSADLNADGGVDDRDFVVFVMYYSEMTP